MPTDLNRQALVQYMRLDPEHGWEGPSCLVIDCNVPITSMDDVKKLADSIAGDTVHTLSILSWSRFETPEDVVK